MSTTTCNIRMDTQLKERFDATAKRIGMPTSTAFNVFARRFVEHGGFPFDVVVEPEYEPFESEEEAADFVSARFKEALDEDKLPPCHPERSR